MTKPEIIDAAFKVWGRNLYQKTSLSQLAGELGVSKPALYRHFVNKQALTAAMIESFFDDFAASILPDYERAVHFATKFPAQASEPSEGIFTIIRSIAGFYGRNLYAFIFSLINLHDRSLDDRDSEEQLKSRGVDMGTLHRVFTKKYVADPVAMRLIFATMTFFMAQFHKTGKSFENPPTEEGIQKATALMCGIIDSGLGLSAGEVEHIDFDALEKLIVMHNTETEPLFKAVAEAVAEAGPWGASMDMVAQRLGFSKSSLYGHFKNRKDMIRRLFTSEFKKIIEFARQALSLSSVPAEQLYLGIYSIAVYLRSQPDFLAALGWVRTRRLDLGKPEKKNEMFRLFEVVDIEQIRNSGEEEKQQMSHWILFLLINILMRSGQIKTHEHNDIRTLYRFLTLGLKGFLR
ncbi:MAG: TetR/AcrR family transcriptional regulator [Treponema sp.]|jgi:AcrR family transcriptional regulator|nr:TetR/AcrR family transcriptional regulator [Treponema sp.]